MGKMSSKKKISFEKQSFCTVIRFTVEVPVGENKIYLKKRELDGSLLSLVDLISNVENSLMKTAYSAGSLQGINKLRSERQVEHENLEKNPQSQLSILTVKLNPQAFSEDIKNKNAADFKTENTSNNKNESRISIEKDPTTTILIPKTKNDKNSSLEYKKENIQAISTEEKSINETEKAIAKTVAEIEVTPILLASRT